MSTHPFLSAEWTEANWKPLLISWAIILVVGGVFTEFRVAVEEELLTDEISEDRAKKKRAEITDIRLGGWILAVAWPIVIPFGAAVICAFYTVTTTAGLFVRALRGTARWYIRRSPKSVPTYRDPRGVELNKESP